MIVQNLIRQPTDKTKNCGFTLIELLVVIAILGLLSTVGLVSFRSSQLKGKDAQRKSDLGHIQRALEMYFNDKGRYPNDLPSGGTAWTDPLEGTTVYIKEVPTDPNGTDYCYQTDANGTFYQVYARLENENDPDLLGTRTCGGESYNYGVASANKSP